MAAGRLSFASYVGSVAGRCGRLKQLQVVLQLVVVVVVASCKLFAMRTIKLIFH